MGCKDKRIVYKESGRGTKVETVEDEMAYRWSLSLAQAESVAKGVRLISKGYGGMIMDSEFCIDQWDRLWFVQARPETRWNEELEMHPHTIFMRRKEVVESAAKEAEVLLEGNGASRGAGQGQVRYLRSALELNKISKGHVLAAERTDPDMVPGMRIASAIMADAGGDTSHAAITSRELGIPAVIGIKRLEKLRTLDGQDVTVDGSRGKVYRGLLPLVEVGGEIDVSQLPATKTKIGLILAAVQNEFVSCRREVFPAQFIRPGEKESSGGSHRRGEHGQMLFLSEGAGEAGDVRGPVLKPAQRGVQPVRRCGKGRPGPDEAREHKKTDHLFLLGAAGGVKLDPALSQNGFTAGDVRPDHAEALESAQGNGFYAQSVANAGRAGTQVIQIFYVINQMSYPEFRAGGQNGNAERGAGFSYDAFTVAGAA